MVTKYEHSQLHIKESSSNTCELKMHHFEARHRPDAPEI